MEWYSLCDMDEGSLFYYKHTEALFASCAVATPLVKEGGVS